MAENPPPGHNCARTTDYRNLRIGHAFAATAFRSLIDKLACPRCRARATEYQGEEQWKDSLYPGPRFLRILVAPERILNYPETNARRRLNETGDPSWLLLETIYGLLKLHLENHQALGFFETPIPPKIDSKNQADYFARFLVYRAEFHDSDESDRALEDLEQAEHLRQQGTDDPELHATLLVAHALRATRIEEAEKHLVEALSTHTIHPDRALELRLDLLQNRLGAEQVPSDEFLLEVMVNLAKTSNLLYRPEFRAIISIPDMQDLILSSAPLVKSLLRSAPEGLVSRHLSRFGHLVRYSPLNGRGSVIQFMNSLHSKFPSKGKNHDDNSRTS